MEDQLAQSGSEIPKSLANHESQGMCRKWGLGDELAPWASERSISRQLKHAKQVNEWKCISISMVSLISTRPGHRSSMLLAR